MTREEASKLQGLVNAALDEAQKLPDRERLRMGAINWGDLSCTDIEERRSLLHDRKGEEDGGVMIAVIIEEASPDAAGLHAWVGRKLDEAGYGLVVVETEW